MQRQLEQIIVAATLAFLLGCHAGLSKLLPLMPALILAAFFLLLLAWGCRQKAGVKLLAAAGIGLCFCCGAASGSGAMRQPQLPLQTFTGQEVRLFGRVEAGSVKVTPQGTSLVLACHTLQQAVQTNSAELGSSLPDTAIAVSGKVRVLVQGQDLSEKTTSGVIVQGTLKPLTDFANPGGWDGGLWSELQDLQGRMSIKGSELYLSGDGQSIRQYISGLAAGLRSNLQHTVPGQTGAVLAGMTLGGYDGISAQTREDFAAVGLAHLLAVSGTHIAVVTGFLLVLLRRRNHCTMALLAGILFFYAALCGFKPPVLRALLMSLALFGAGVSGRLPQRSNIFCAVVILLLCYEPRWLWDAGFQLSFTTTAGLLYFYPVLSGLCTRYLPVGIAEILAVSLTAQLAALPFLIHYFHQLSLSGLAANLLLVPLLELALLLTLAGYALLPVFGLESCCFYWQGFYCTPC